MNEHRLQSLKSIINEWNTDPIFEQSGVTELHIIFMKQALERALYEDSDDSLN